MREPWSMQDQLDLMGRRGRLRQATARRRYAVRSAKALRTAQESTARFEAFTRGELTADEYYTKES